MKALLARRHGNRRLTAELQTDLLDVRRPYPEAHHSWPDAYSAEGVRSEKHTSELQSLMRISYAVFCLKKKNKQSLPNITNTHTMYRLTSVIQPNNQVIRRHRHTTLHLTTD